MFLNAGTTMVRMTQPAMLRVQPLGAGMARRNGLNVLKFGCMHYLQRDSMGERALACGSTGVCCR
jgi:hypothetical protein